MTEENPYQAPQTRKHRVEPPVSNRDRWPYLEAIVTCLVSGTILGAVVNQVFELEGKGGGLTNAVGICVWVAAILLGVLAYRRAARSASRPAETER